MGQVLVQLSLNEVLQLRRLSPLFGEPFTLPPQVHVSFLSVAAPRALALGVPPHILEHGVGPYSMPKDAPGQDGLVLRQLLDGLARSLPPKPAVPRHAWPVPLGAGPKLAKGNLVPYRPQPLMRTLHQPHNTMIL
eukprot:15466096-Alexandrium_andersonii.AAC.1